LLHPICALSSGYIRSFSFFRYVSDQNLWTKHEIQHLRLPTLDFSNPQVENLFHGVEFLRTVRAEHKTAYIHCKAGRQRSANLAACYLIDTYGMTPEEAARRIRSIRPSTIFGKREIARLHDFVAHLQEEYYKKQQKEKEEIKSST
jgi:protein-tyrosine phosphatase